MKIKLKMMVLISGLIALLTMPALASPAAQKKLQKSPGGYHGELDFPISWSRYYSYAEWTGIMHKIQKKYPQLSDIESIGKSRMGRDQYLITITAKATGKHSEKPAMWVDGAVHGNEVNGITCSLYVMWYLLTRYDYDPFVYELVNNTTFYILPGLNVDANASFVEHPNTAHNPREPFRPEDNDGDGLYDEDRTEDVDGDGELSVMYQEDPEGGFKLSVDGRRFVAVDGKEEKVKRFRLIGQEGFDNDGDGLINEDDIGGPDPNRNYPFDWNLQAGNPYPMSEPCTRNAYEFMRTHPNIFASFHYHNIGRLIMFIAPPQVERRQTPEQRQLAQERLNQYLAEQRKTNKYAQAFDITVKPGYEEDMNAQAKIVSAGARILKNYRPVTSGGMGQTPASAYGMLGAYAYLIELWGPPAFDADENDDGQVSDEELIKWIDIELNGEGWIDPHKVKHPDLGEIWIGGSRKKHMYRTPPARYIEMEAYKNAQFVLYCASQFPKVEFESVKVVPAAKDLYWVEATILNDRIYPTASDRAIALKRAAKDKLLFKTSDNVTALDIPQKETQLDPVNLKPKSTVIPKKGATFRLKGKERKSFCVLVKMKGSSGWVEFNVDSQHGGKAKKRINIKTD